MKNTLKFFSLLVVFSFWSLAAHAAPQEITWEDLIPLNNSGKTMKFSTAPGKIGMPALSEFGGSTQDLNSYVEALEFMKEMQPDDGNDVAGYLDGKTVKIAGYVTPLTFDGDNVVEFLFVPYHGACIHVPPPPANQIVYVTKAKGLSADALFEPFWLIGKLRVQPINTIVANTGYWVESARVEPFGE